MANFKNIRMKKPGGGSRMQRVKVLASGKYRFVKNLTKRRASNPRASKKPRKVRNVTRRKNTHRRGKSMVTTAFKLVRLGALAAPAANELIFGADTPAGRVKHVIKAYTGYDMYSGTFAFENLAKGWLPYIGACLTTYGIPKLVNIIRRL